MQLTELIENFNLQPAANGVAGAERSNTSQRIDAITITRVTDDSRRCIPGCLFVARSGTDTDGSQFIESAIENGAAAVLCDPAIQPDTATALFLHPPADVRVDNLLLGQLAERFHGYPSRKLKLIGVTGTNGKTTIAHLVQQLLAAEGMRVGLIGTVILDDGAERKAATLTTPGAAEFSELLAKMVANGCHAAVAEVSSHALDQDRTAALDFDVAVFSNLTQDHLDYHETMDKYAAAKARLFAGLGEGGHPGAAVVNMDDGYAGMMVEAAGESEIVGCSLGANRQAVCFGEVMQLQPHGCRASFDGPWGLTELTLPMVGEHNVCNALLAAAAAQQVADLTDSIDYTLAHCQAVPGRLEMVASDRQTQPTVVVDYAHTPDALENVLKALRKVSDGKLVVMFGCGGDRDRAKRPLMGEIAVRLADRVVVTSDNPRTEDAKRIIDDILQGIGKEAMGKVLVEADRRKAIGLAIGGGEGFAPGPGAGDVVLLAGKGHEDYQVIGKERVWFDDRVVAVEWLG